MISTNFKLSPKYIVLTKTICVCLIIQADLDKILTFNFIYATKENVDFIINKIYIIKKKFWFITHIISFLSYISNKQATIS